MIERKDNTSAMARVGRFVLSGAVILMWSGFVLMTSFMLADGIHESGWGFLKIVIAAVVMPSAHAAVWFSLQDIWLGPLKTPESKKP